MPSCAEVPEFMRSNVQLACHTYFQQTVNLQLAQLPTWSVRLPRDTTPFGARNMGRRLGGGGALATCVLVECLSHFS